MSLREYCEIQDGCLVPDYKPLIDPIRCDRCEAPAGAVIAARVSETRWLCPLCHEETESAVVRKERADYANKR
uniref:Uncharacterized protein n=1 Tax=Leptospirillum ferrodiazotrophum TaxID=412449 RepID=C6HVZ9_9BACT|nr:MAG: hypothetical protein UBAL3_80150050 [Leptospirillum ferrodiazotrophum]